MLHILEGPFDRGLGVIDGGVSRHRAGLKPVLQLAPQDRSGRRWPELTCYPEESDCRGPYSVHSQNPWTALEHVAVVEQAVEPINSFFSPSLLPASSRQ